MQGYDATLKLLLRSSSTSAFQQIFRGAEVREWINAEFPQVRTPRADLLGATATGGLIHVELQSENKRDMAVRMAEYALAIYQEHQQFPEQVVLYVGEAAMRMDAKLGGAESGSPNFSFRFRLFDVRDLDGEALLESAAIEDNLLAVLTRLKNQKAVVRDILDKIAHLPDSERRRALTQFLIISGLRRLAQTVTEEVRKMPILNDLLSHEVIGPAILQGRQEGRQEGHQELLLTLIGKRFGAVPSWVEDRLSQLSLAELDEVAIRLLDAPNLETLFPKI